MKQQILFCLLTLAGVGISPAVAQTGGGRPGADPTPSEKIEKGLDSVKEGTREAAESAKVSAKELSAKASEAGDRVGRAFKAATCPIVGDRKTKIYYASDNKRYEEVLSGQKYFSDDDRACFMTEAGAREDGYTRSTQ